MKFMINRVAVGLLLVSLFGATAFAKHRQARVDFAADLNVNGTVVKKGSYKVVFNEETGELSILKNGDVVASTNARLEARSRKAGGTEVHTRKVDMGYELTGFAFSGANENVVLNQAGMQAGGK